MTIQEAKEEITRTLRAYLKRNPDGSHRIPTEKQRPLLLIGPPGIGKTAIMKQIAEETGTGLVAYTMTHHTRQSAIGLPFIMKKNYQGRDVSITEYTMSEIVASIYEYMNQTGHTSGILFLDEINCVSETLAPVMLQLLQNKTFGNHPLPEDWVIVAAGNPPEYNKSVRDLDMVTLDRVKHMEIEANLPVWQNYARMQGVHPAIRTYLTVYPEHFYVISNTDRGQIFVTARGWEDLSCILTSYEEDQEEIREELFLQYLQHDEIAHSFALFYDLFRHYFRDGEEDFTTRLAASPDALANCSATECLSISAMLFHRIQEKARSWAEENERLARIRELLALIPAGNEFASEETRQEFFRQKYEAVEIRVLHKIMKPEEEFKEKHILKRMEKDAAEWQKSLATGTDVPADLATAGAGHPDRGTADLAMTGAGHPELDTADLAMTGAGHPEHGTADSQVSFTEYEMRKLEAAGAGQEDIAGTIADEIENAYTILGASSQSRSSLLYLTTDLTGDPHTSQILETHPSPSWLRYGQELVE